MNPVHCEQLSKSFRSVPAVQQFSLSVRPGEIMALLGPSGCGKTTVLRLIAGFERPDAGRIAIGEREVAAPGLFVPPERRHVGMVFQHYALFPHLSVGDNVAYGLRGKGRQAAVREMLDLVGLGGLERRMPHELSGGQQQRVALARALAPRPAVLLLDEPFSNLDADLRAALRTQVREIIKHVGTTALFVTHDQEEALYMGDRVAVMNAGHLEQAAEPEALFAAPATRFVAEFIGQASFVPAAVTENGLDTELGFVPQPVSAPSGTLVEAVARPDDLVLSADPQGNARIVSRTFRGGEYVYEVALLGSQRTLRCVCNHVHDYAADTRVRVALAPGHALAWFPVSEAR
ncbi:MAG: ABC transporter ATP-binding protein [Chloroflexota bacterium]|nr:MAG: ABC transporter ATP-binding protein [Chloroflexota bacterium]